MAAVTLRGVDLWLRGDVVVWRSMAEEATNPHPAYSIPTIVVEDTPEFTALYQPTGTISARHSGRRDGPRGALRPGAWDGTFDEIEWTGPPTIRLHPIGAGYSVIRYWINDSWRRWYINLEAPWRRTRIGFDSRDEVLDLVPADDLSTVELKDEDEFEWACGAGVIDGHRAALIRSRADAAVADVTARRWPFDADWSRWTPDPGWPRPSLPSDWNVTRSA